MESDETGARLALPERAKDRPWVIDDPSAGMVARRVLAVSLACRAGRTTRCLVNEMEAHTRRLRSQLDELRDARRCERRKEARR